MGGSFADRIFGEPQRDVGRKPKTTSPSTTQRPKDWVLHLQRTVGNQAVAGLLQGGIRPSRIPAQDEPTGEPLDPATRLFMESRFGQDFSQIRIHAQAGAEKSAQTLDAQAYTVGRDIVFGPGHYAPHTASGRQLLAHELVHALQQGSTMGWPGDGLQVARPGDRLEQEADIAAQSALSGSAQAFQPTSVGRMVQRQQGEQKRGAVLDYDAFMLPDGAIKDGDTAHRLTQNWQQLEQVYADAENGNTRAQRFIRDLEEVYAAAGVEVAEKVYSLLCQVPVIHEVAGCIPNWSFFDFLRRDKPGGQRLRTALGDSYERKSRELGVRNEIIGHALNLLYAGMVVKGVVAPKGVRTAPEATVASKPPGGFTEASATGKALGESSEVSASTKTHGSPAESTIPVEGKQTGAQSSQATRDPGSSWAQRPPSQSAVGKGAKAWGAWPRTNTAVGRLPRFSGKVQAFVEDTLKKAGFREVKPNEWVHPDGSYVRIDPAHAPGGGWSPNDPYYHPTRTPEAPYRSHNEPHYHKEWRHPQTNDLYHLDDAGYINSDPGQTLIIGRYPAGLGRP
jgi:hypothetical protein